MRNVQCAAKPPEITFDVGIINEALWSKYAQLRGESFKNDGDGSEATEFYRQNHATMDDGAVIAWPQRYNSDELSAIQHAMNLKLQDEAAFFAEYQNEPLPEQQGDTDHLTAEQIAEKLSSSNRGQVPIGCNHLTMFIDVHAKALFYVVAAWEDDFTGYVIDYGTWPDQKQAYFNLRTMTKTLAGVSAASGLEGAIYDGLDKLTSSYLARQWRRDDGAYLSIDRCLIDANWGQSTDVVYKFCRQSTIRQCCCPATVNSWAHRVSHSANISKNVVIVSVIIGEFPA